MKSIARIKLNGIVQIMSNRMKLYLLILLLAPFLLLFTGKSFSQTSTFDRTYPELGDTCVGTSILPMQNGHQIFSAYNNGKLILGELDTLWEIKWFKKYNTHQLSLGVVPLHILPTKIKMSNIIITEDNNLMVVSSKKIIDSLNKSGLLVMKTNLLGDTLWTKTYGSSTSWDLGFDIYSTKDGGYIIGAGQYDFSLKPKVFKIDSVGNLIWKREFSPSNIFSNILGQLNKNYFIVLSNFKMELIDENGITKWVKDIENSGFLTYSVATNSQSEIFLWSMNTIEKLDSLGNTLWKKQFKNDARVIKLVKPLENENLLLVGIKKLIKTNKFGDILWTKNILSSLIHDIHEIEENGYLFVGGIEYPNYKFWILKTDYNGHFNALKILPFGRTSELDIEQCETIDWYNSGSNKIDLTYSTDKGVSWQNIVHNQAISEGYGSLQWDLPDIIQDSTLLSIFNSENPKLTDTIVISLIHDVDLKKDYKFIAANEIKMWIGNNGDGSHDPINSDGFFWPGGNCADISSVFEDGFVYGGIVDSLVNVNGSTYRQGWQPGNILDDGTAADPNDPKFKIWKIKNGWEYMPASIIRNKYEYDYNNWPVELGAPWIDVDGNGTFSREIDKPELLGDEVLFHVSNDLDPEITSFTYGSPPIGLEFQVTVWAHNTSDFLKDVVFKKYVMINKSGKTIKDMYFSYWADIDMGFAEDDFIGCDTLLNLAYQYNGDNYDGDILTDEYYDRKSYYGFAPPAVGHMIVQGPTVPVTGQDSAKYKNRWIKEYTNLGLSSFTFYIGGDPIYSDPDLGVYSGTLKIYNNMSGLGWEGDPFINPRTGNPTKFCLSGDPVGETGWYEGPGYPNGNRAGDRRYIMSSGPFDVAPGDTQEVVYAIFMARGSDNIQSVAELKNTARAIQDYWDNVIYTNVGNENSDVLPTQFALNQNYPNPFNPTTTIRYSIPSPVISNPFGDERSPNNNEISPPTSWTRNNKINVQLVVFDILGRQVKTLVNEKKKKGNYTVQFDASNLSSGVYFYRLKSGNLIKTRKMLLLK